MRDFRPGNLTTFSLLGLIPSSLRHEASRWMRDAGGKHRLAAEHRLSPCERSGGEPIACDPAMTLSPSCVILRGGGRRCPRARLRSRWHAPDRARGCHGGVLGDEAQAQGRGVQAACEHVPGRSPAAPDRHPLRGCHSRLARRPCRLRRGPARKHLGPSGPERSAPSPTASARSPASWPPSSTATTAWSPT